MWWRESPVWIRVWSRCVSGVVASVPKCVLPSMPCVKETPHVEETTCVSSMVCVGETARVSERLCVRGTACEVAVCEGDGGRHAGARDRMSESECNGVVCECRDMQVCVGGTEAMETATEGQRPSGGRSCYGNRAGFARRRARGSCCAAHKAATCSVARVKPGPETHAVDVADPATDRS